MKLIFVISEKLNSRLEAVAARHEISKAALARISISKYLQVEEGVKKNEDTPQTA